MTRCPVTARDGRRCCRPTHDAEVKHLLVKERLLAGDFETALKVAHAWGWSGRMAESAVKAAMSVGPIPSEKLVSTMEGLAAVSDRFTGWSGA